MNSLFTVETRFASGFNYGMQQSVRPYKPQCCQLVAAQCSSDFGALITPNQGATITVEAHETSGTLHQGWEAAARCSGRNLCCTPGVKWPGEMIEYGAQASTRDNIAQVFDYSRRGRLKSLSELRFTARCQSPSAGSRRFRPGHARIGQRSRTRGRLRLRKRRRAFAKASTAGSFVTSSALTLFSSPRAGRRRTWLASEPRSRSIRESASQGRRSCGVQRVQAHLRIRQPRRNEMEISRRGSAGGT